MADEEVLDNNALCNVIDIPKSFGKHWDSPDKDHEGKPIQEGFYQLRDTSGKIIPGSIAHVKLADWIDKRTNYAVSTPQTGPGIYKFLLRRDFQRFSRLEENLRDYKQRFESEGFDESVDFIDRTKFPRCLIDNAQVVMHRPKYVR